MSKGTLNRVILVGNVGRDPEIKHMETGFSVANLSLATTESYKDKKTGENIEKTEWHRVVAFGKLSILIEQYVGKGSKLLVEGSLQTRKWQDKETGSDRYTTEIVAQKIQFMSSRSSESKLTDDEESKGNKIDCDFPKDVADMFNDDIPF